jgi:hypothetical protein
MTSITGMTADQITALMNALAQGGFLPILELESAGAAQAGMYQQIAEITITQQYDDARVAFMMGAIAGGSNYSSRATVHFRVKQQAAMGSAPFMEVEVSDVWGNSMAVSNFTAVVTENDSSATVVQLWFQAPQNYESYYIFQLYQKLGTTSTIQFATSTNLWASSLPAGTKQNGINDKFGRVLSTPDAGFALANSTSTILTYTAPSDSPHVHRVEILSTLHVSSAETGGAISVAITAPDGTVKSGIAIFAAAQGVGVYSNVQAWHVEAGSTVTITQSSALTAGAAVAWIDILAL